MSTIVRLPKGIVRAAVRAARPMVTSPRLPIAAQRWFTDALTRADRPPSGTRRRPATVGGVPGERLTPPRPPAEGTLLYLHGGGYVIGSPRSHRALAARLAARIGVSAFVPAYRLAPEHPYPAALDDTLAAYGGLLDDGVPPERIAVAGDSAGGGLALALAMALRDRGDPAPAVVGLLCPWLDLRPDLADGRTPAPREPLLTPAATARWAAAYVAGNDPADPAISPLFGDLSGLPPLVLHYAADDLLAGDGERLVARADAAGAALEHRRYDGLWHDFHAQADVLAAADEAVVDFADTLAARMAAPGTPPRVGIIGAGR